VIAAQVKQNTPAGVADIGTYVFAALPRMGEILLLATTQDVCAKVVQIERFPAVFLPDDPIMVTGPNVVLWVDRMLPRHAGTPIPG
jgi:hypothetical protein